MSNTIVELNGKRGLVVGIANEHSIAYGCAKMLHTAGAQLAATYLNVKAEPFVKPLAQALEAPIVMPCDVREPGQLEAVFERIGQEWGRLDFVLHSIAFAPKDEVRERTPGHRLAGIDEIGRVAAFLASDAGAPLTGSVVYADAGFHVVS